MKIDETNLKEEMNLFFVAQAKELKKKFEKRRINFYSCLDKDEVINTIMKIIADFVWIDEEKKIISYGDSVTLHQLEIHELIDQLVTETDGYYEINNPLDRYSDGKLKAYGLQPEGKLNLPKEDYIKLQQKLLKQLRSTLLSDILITGANAITRDGDIVSTDGAGNRVAGSIFGPGKVIIVVGKNKLVPNIEQAIQRNRNVAAPLNYLRHNLKHHNRYDTPCISLGRCIDCDHPRRACLNTVIISGAVEANKDRIHLVFVNENLGF